MPGWSPEIANEFIDLAIVNHHALHPLQLQKLVYVAHGWCLGATGEPLTGDRPEARSFGPIYRRLFDALAAFGPDPVIRKIYASEFEPLARVDSRPIPAKAELNTFEMDAIALVYEDFGTLPLTRLSKLTQGPGTAWSRIYSATATRFIDIPHELIRDQFEQFAEETAGVRETGQDPDRFAP